RCFQKAGLLATKVKAADFDPAQVKTIIVTHFHPDHITGLMGKDTNAQISPNAEINVPAVDYKYWTDPVTTGGAAKRIQTVFPMWKKIRRTVPGTGSASTEGAGAKGYRLPNCRLLTRSSRPRRTTDSGRGYFLGHCRLSSLPAHSFPLSW